MESITNKQTQITLQSDILWLEAVIETAIALYFNNENEYKSIKELKLPDIIEEDRSGYAQILRRYNLVFEERLMFIMALIRHLKPQSLDLFLIKNKALETEFSEFGGSKDETQHGFVPTLETVCFLLGGANNIEIRMAFMRIVYENNNLYKEGILEAKKQPVELNEPLQLSEEFLGIIITNKKYVPKYNSKFPAEEITTKMDWDDLILETSIKNQLIEVKEWLEHSDLILNQWKLNKTLKPGYRVLFYGSPGTGKTLAATLLGKAIETPVFRIDLSMIVSKYIGETEKNLGRLFDIASSKGWILFFDEADALFSKRTDTNTSNDRHANQEVAYLLQRIESFDGLVVLATNLQTNIDEAFLRRFQNTINFPKPKYRERKILWENLVSNTFEVEEGQEVLDTIARDYELSGGEMINVLRYCAIRAANKGEKKISFTNIMTGIKREYKKSNKTFN
ncbi:ATP-binding protein [Flavivirga abyssicola]|uniref:ATP-binding protein n=1 Tax=Flavivirga abyssicola TaxID=3063533 RepID=UPI0026DF5222|nr:ATP-binding protein [Flavivirga sp. MEBiC07777]WVK12627.1 ATP-binding protein [Flavivirga sp. MEBiC07777]